MKFSRINRRSTLGVLAPVLTFAFASLFVFLAFLHAGDEVWMKMGPVARIFVAGCLLFTAAVIEMLVLRQKKFVDRAVSSTVIVDDIRPLSWSAEHFAAQYHFFTEDRRVISACCAITAADRDEWVVGSRLRSIYDPARPARHALETQRLWAIRWTPNVTGDEAFDEAVASMIAIAPRQAA